MGNKKEQFEYVYVEEDGTVRELHNDEIEYLNTEFAPSDGARPYIKSRYTQLTPDKKISGFLLRKKIPKGTQIKKSRSKYLEIRSLINVYNSGKIIYLQVGIYSVKIVGGWDVTIGNFNFVLKNRRDSTLVSPKTTKWRVQSYEMGQRAKKIMVLDIQKPGKYEIEFSNQEDLRVRPSNLFFAKLFEKEIPNKNIKIWIG
ncbi:hypothetical protein [Ulvibacterium marinum]|uniref:hypothetical protein n=1 Tax=Ulvibacterium marinum TaxID=2419782 RepID=UPI0024948952|nr:hypothetical protein [Ulvibacterium marinum]